MSTEKPDPIRPAREEATGTARDESLSKDLEMIFLNHKRTYDEYQDVALTSARRSQLALDELQNQRIRHAEELHRLSVQAMQNAIETANMVGKNATVNIDALQKQHTAHRDIATDASWNPVQQGAGDTLTARAVSIDDASLKAIGAVVAAAVANAFAPKSE